MDENPYKSPEGPGENPPPNWLTRPIDSSLAFIIVAVVLLVLLCLWIAFRAALSARP